MIFEIEFHFPKARFDMLLFDLCFYFITGSSNIVSKSEIFGILRCFTLLDLFKSPGVNAFSRYFWGHFSLDVRAIFWSFLTYVFDWVGVGYNLLRIGCILLSFFNNGLISEFKRLCYFGVWFISVGSQYEILIYLKGSLMFSISMRTFPSEIS